MNSEHVYAMFIVLEHQVVWMYKLLNVKNIYRWFASVFHHSLSKSSSILISVPEKKNLCTTIEKERRKKYQRKKAWAEHQHTHCLLHKYTYVQNETSIICVSLLCPCWCVYVCCFLLIRCFCCWCFFCYHSFFCCCFCRCCSIKCFLFPVDAVYSILYLSKASMNCC